MSHVPTFVPLEEAQRIVLARVRPLPPVTVDLAEALGMTLAKNVCCDTDVPFFDRAMMDGYAVRSADVAKAPARLDVIGSVAAGGDSAVQVGPGQAVQINTGAPLPPGADAVVKVEDTTPETNGQAITVNSPYEAEKNICRRGEYVSAGACVLPSGTRMGASQLAAAATAGAARLMVHARPKTSVLVTGNEVVDVSAKPVGAQIRNSNGPALMALLAEEGLAPVSLGVAGDDRSELEEKIRRGLTGDCLCITGGISMGTLDLVPEILKRCGVSFHFRKMCTKPAKPTIFGTTESGCCVFALPGNPVSALVAFWLIVRPALAAMQGRSGRPTATVRATLHGIAQAADRRQRYWPVKLRTDDDGQLLAEALSWSGSGDVFGMSAADGLLVRRPHSAAAQSGDAVDVLMFERL